MPQKKNAVRDTVRVECYRMSPAEIADLKRWLGKSEGVATLKEYRRAASPLGPELGELVGVQLQEFFVKWVGNKILSYVAERVLAWAKARRKEPFLITLDLNGRKKKIGKGKPKKRAA